MDLTKVAAAAYYAGIVVLSVGVFLLSVPAGLIVFGSLIAATAAWALKESE